MSIRGLNGYTFVGSIASEFGLVPSPVASVQIIVPDLSEAAEQRLWQVLFVWDSEVSDFELTDITTSAGISLSEFTKVDGTQYIANVMLPEDMDSSGTITVLAESVSSAAGLSPAVSTSLTFDFDTTSIDDGLPLLCSRFRTYFMKDLDSVLLDNERSGGAYSGIMEMVKLGDYIYFVVQVQKYDQVLLGRTYNRVLGFLYRLYRHQAGALLFRLNTADCTFEIIKAYPSITLAARSLTVHNNRLYYIEGSHYAYLNEGEATLGFENDKEVRFLHRRLLGVPADWKGRIGHVYSLVNPSVREPNPTPVDLGLNYASALPSESERGIDRFYGTHGATASPIVDADGLTFITGYGNLDTINSPESDVSKYGNWQLVRYGNDLEFRLPELETNGRRGFEIVKQLAIATNSIVGFDKNAFTLRPCIPFSGEWLDYSYPDLRISKLNRIVSSYPPAGLIGVGNELIRYDSVDQRGGDIALFNVVERGALGTEEQTHVAGSDVFWIDHYLGLDQSTLDQPVDTIVVTEDTNNIYNRILINYGGVDPYIAEDQVSIDTYGVREFSVTVPLGIGNIRWVSWISGVMLKRFKFPNSLINLELKPSWHLKVGDIVFIKVSDRLNLCVSTQIVSLTHSVRVDFDGSHVVSNVQLLTL